jgi:hypothetical protein
VGDIVRAAHVKILADKSYFQVMPFGKKQPEIIAQDHNGKSTGYSRYQNLFPPGEQKKKHHAEKLNGEIEVPSVVEVEALYGHPLEISNCILYTTLYDLTDDEEEPDAPSPEADGEEEEGEYEAYAFLIDNIVVHGNGGSKN